MAAKGNSKTSRAALRATSAKAGSFSRAADAPLFIPTGNGRYCYVFSPEGKTMHVRTDSTAMTEAISMFKGTEYEAKARTELARHAETFSSWNALVEALDDATEVS